MKMYSGIRTNDGIIIIHVTENHETRRLSPAPSLKLYNHSPSGFNWGYNGSGPAQTALAILLDCIGEEKALLYYQKFKFEFVSTWSDFFHISELEIIQMLDHTHSN